MIIAFPFLFVTLSFGQSNGHDFSVAKNLEIFNTLYKSLDMTYVDTLSADTMVIRAIDAMLGSTDAFTEYFSESETKDLRQMTTGKYAGIGALIQKRIKDKWVRISEPYEHHPAADAGLRPGDEILEIDGKSMEDKSSSEVSNSLLGDPNTTLELKVRREGVAKPLDFKITRQTIHIPAVPYYGFLPDSVGYIYLESVTDACSKEMKRALVDLKTRGAKALVLDLRGNGGGSLQEAVEIVNLFVDKGKHIVEMRGRIKSANADFKTLNEPMDTSMPLAVLVDENTASSAEIISGSLQDLDRAVIIGARTFGKGLVQEPLNMPYGGVLKVTTSKYYIPSGRCIQAFAYKNMDRIGFSTRVPDSLTHVFRTAAGREVRDGGGITPDIKVAPSLSVQYLYDRVLKVADEDSENTDSLSSNMVNYLIFDDMPMRFVCRYAAVHKSIAPADHFSITDGDFADFGAMLKENKFTYDRGSDVALKRLKLLAKFEGYYDNSKAEFDALEKKLTHSLDKDLVHYRKDIVELLNSEIVKYYYYRRGVLLNHVSGTDDCISKARAVLNNMSRYKAILHQK